jgi:diacylglycerol kinase family enzyme
MLTARALWSFRPDALTIALDDGVTIDSRPVLLTAANTPEYGHGATIAPGALPDDGLLDVCIVDGVSAFTMVRHAYRLFNSTIGRMPGYRRVRTAGLKIARPRPGPYQADGESLMGGETLEILVVPKGLRVVLPESRLTG